MENIIHVLCIICAAVMLAMAAAMWLHERGLFEAMARFLPRSVAERLLLAVVVVGFIHYGATKEANGVRGVSAPMRNAARMLTQEEIDAGYALVRVGTNETFDFSASSNAVIVEKWRRRGAAHDRFDVAPGAAQWLFPLGTGVVERLTVTSGGEVLPCAQGGARVFLPAPYRATLGIVPEMNWGLLPPAASPSMAWWEATPSNSLVVTWRNALVNRTTNRVASVQAEYFASGDFAHRYSPGTTNFTSLLYRRLDPLLDTPGGDRDGDGLSTSDELFIYGTDPGIPDTSGDGLLDGEAVAQGLDPLLRHLSDAEILERVAASSTNEAFASPVLATNSVAAWQMFGGFAADWPANAATNIVWERTFSVNRVSAWQQLFVSASPDAAAAWELRGAVLEWEADAGTSGCASASPLCDSLRIPLATNDMPQSVTLRVRASGAGFVRSPTPIYLVAYAPQFRVEGGSEIVGQSGATFYVSTSGAGSAMLLAVDHSRRPHRASPGDDECDMAVFEELTAGNDDFSYDGDATGGTITANRPGIYALPDFSPDVSPPMRLRSPRRSGGGGKWLVVLDPSVWWGCDGHGCGYDGLGYDWEGDWYYEEDYYPLGTKCLRKRWYRDWGGGWHDDRCRLRVFSGLGDDGGYVTTSTDGDTGRIYVDGVLVWSGDAEHVYDDWGCYEERVEIEECDECDDDCANGNCDSMEGPELGSLRFRIPLGAPVKNQVAGFVWFATEGPTNISSSTFRLLAHPDATITETASAGTRRIACHDSRGRDLRISDIANGARVTIYDTAAQTLEHTWEIVNVGGSPSCVRLRKISRLDNVMSDETFTYSDGDWTRFDNIAKVGTQLTTYDDFSDYGDGTKWETRTTTDESGNVLECVTTERSRVGDCDNAVLRETYREEWTGTEWKWSRADYWNDPAHSGRHGRQRLVWGNARAWVYTDFDGKGHEVLRVEQRGSADIPADFPYVVSNELCNVAALSDAYVTVRDFAPLDGDSRHQDDAAKPRCETRYVVRNGVATVIGRTSWRYTRLMRDGFAAIKKETWRMTENSPTLNSSTPNSYSYEITYADTGEGTPLLMRNSVAESLDEDGILTVNSYSLSGGVLSCESRRFGREASGVRREFETYGTVESDASYGTVLRRTTRLTANGAAIADEQSIYDSQNRLRSTTYLDGTSLTNAYSCCRLLWKRDREGRKVLRSAQTGTDHLYNAMEDVWLAEVSTNGFKVTRHYFDALGRETNTVVYVGTTPGEATSFSTTPPLPNSRTSTTYPYGGSAYSIATDERGKVTVRRSGTSGGSAETEERTITNGVEVARTVRRYGFDGDSSYVRREWTAWTEECRFTDYDSDGCRVACVVTAASDHSAVTNSISTYDFLGRLVSRSIPGANGTRLVTSNAYDGASSRLATSTLHAQGLAPRTTTYLYNDFGEQVGTMLDGITMRTDTTYEQISNEWWRVETSIVVGSATNSSHIAKTQLTGLSDSCRRHTVELEERGDPTAPQTVTETIVAFDSSTEIETETVTSSIAPTIIRRYKHGMLFSEETIGETTSRAYDARGRIAATCRAIGNAASLPLQSFEYATCGDILATHTYTNETDMITESYSYDMLGNRTATTDALGNTIFRSYDSFGQIIAEYGATYPVRYAYDTQSRRTALSTTRSTTSTFQLFNLSTFQLAQWDTTAWTYDPATGNCLSKSYADGSTVTYTYAPDNLPLRTTYASGRWKENVYDTKRKLIGVTYSGGEVDGFSYDEFGNEVAASNEAASVVSFRDDRGNCTNETAIVGNEGKTTVRFFDEHRRLTEIDGTAYAYNPDGVLASISNDLALVEYAYAPDHLDAGYTLTLSNGVVFSRGLVRDGFRRSLVTGIASSGGDMSAENIAYAYDALNRPTCRNGDTFGYNARSEVTAATIGSNFALYGYDGIGNSTNWPANNLNQYSLFSHDLDGNMLSDGIITFAYDAANRLKTVSSNGVLLVTNFYDANSRRVKKVTPEATSTYFYDNWNLIEERIACTNGTTMTIRYFWGKDLSGTLQGAGGVGGLLYLTVSNSNSQLQLYIPTYDNNGNITRYLDANGNTVAQYNYNVFGDLTSKSGSIADFFRHRFSTKYFDVETGLYYYGYRFYHPPLMRWLNRDPIEEEGGVNLYCFCRNLPTAFSDPHGDVSISESLIYLYDLTGGVSENSILAYTKAIAGVATTCKCHAPKQWSLSDVNVDILTQVHLQKFGYGDLRIELFVHVAENEHVTDIRNGIKDLISPSLYELEYSLKENTYQNNTACVTATRAAFKSKTNELIRKIESDSVFRHDTHEKHTWRW